MTFSVATWYLLSPSIIGVLGSAASFVVTVGLTGFEMLIQALQAYVFTLLAAVYINGRQRPLHSTTRPHPQLAPPMTGGTAAGRH